MRQRKLAVKRKSNSQYAENEMSRVEDSVARSLTIHAEDENSS
ncbi:MAG: hypothetical protein ABSD30_13235 [Candidatus Binatus sp.]